MKKIYLFFLILLFGGCAKDYIPLSSDLKEDISVEMYLVNDPSCIKLEVPIEFNKRMIESISEKPILDNKSCSQILYVYKNIIDEQGIYLILKDEYVLKREAGDEILLLINEVIVEHLSMGHRGEIKEFIWRMSLSELEKNIKDKNKIFYDKIKELEEKKK